MKAVLTGVICGVLLAVGAFTCLLLESLTRAVDQLPTTVDLAISREGAATRKVAGDQITAVADKLDGQVTGLRTDLFARVDTIESDAKDQLVAIRTDAGAQITDTRTALVKEIADSRTPLLALLPPMQNVLANASDTSDLMLNCEFNPDCLANRSQVTTVYKLLLLNPGNLYCRLFHRSISRPVGGRYRCWRCLREFEIGW